MTAEREVTIVTYHYVRDPDESRFPRIHGRKTGEFANQLAHLSETANFVSPNDLVHAVLDPEYPLPDRAVLLTFDDGYKDHFAAVLPALRDAGLTGAFFPVVSAVKERRVLDVNKIHFILAASDDHRQLARTLMGMIDERGPASGLETSDAYWRRWGKPGRWDDANTFFVKRMLQKGLPDGVRGQFTDRLFRDFVTADEEEFAAELYMSEEELCQLAEAGMYIGNHGYSHAWLDALATEEQELEVDHALSFLAELGMRSENWIMCYPYGGHSPSLLEVVRNKGGVVGLTVTPGVAKPGVDDPLLFPRLDTNFLPTTAPAA